MFPTENDVFVFSLKFTIWKGVVDAPIGFHRPIYPLLYSCKPYNLTI